METITVDEFRARCKAQGVSATEHVALVCPVCATPQSIATLMRAGATADDAERAIGFACEGRFTNAGPWPNKPTAKRRAVRGCDWTLGGLFHIHKLEVVTEDGVHHPRFEIASPQQAQELERMTRDAAPREVTDG